MKWITVPSGRVYNLDNYAQAVPNWFSSVTNQELDLQEINGSVTTVKGDDAVYLYWYLRYSSPDAKWSGFDSYFDKVKNETVTT